MILQSKARPVRIRIKSGGEEHSSFESLKRHFCIKDLLPSAKDGRLSRWLRQQGKEMVADSIDAQSRELPVAEDLSSIAEQAYIRFVLAFFESELNCTQIISKNDLLEQWNTTSYSSCEECQNLAKEIEEEKMKSSYSLALKKYKEEPNSRTKIEWMDIFIHFKTKKINDADYNWLMYEITSMEVYLEKSAELGHEKAKDKLMPKRFGKDVRTGLFIDVLSKIPSELNNRRQREEATRVIANLSLGTKEERTIKDDILRLLDACNGYMCSGDFRDILENVQILKDEALFLNGVFCFGRNDNKRAAALLSQSKYSLAPLFREFMNGNGFINDNTSAAALLSQTMHSLAPFVGGSFPNVKGFIIAKDSLREIERKAVNMNMFRSGSHLSNFGMITHFVIVHIFDSICYEKL